MLFFVVKTFFNNKKEHLLLKSDAKNEALHISINNKGESLLVKTLLLNNWLSIPEIYKSSYKTLRQTFISEITNRTAIPKKGLIQLSDKQLSSIALTYRFLLESEIKTLQELKLMSIQHLKQTVVQVNNEQTNHTVSALENFSMSENLRVAYQWWLPQKNASLITEINKIGADKIHFKVKDNHNSNTDVLRIVKANEAPYKYLGVYHNMVSKNGFTLYLAGSNDLKSWTRITSLGNRSHQGDIKKWGNGYLITNEEDKKEGSNNIKVRFYKSYKDLCANQPKHSISLSKTFSHYAEGTPDIREIIGKNPEDSHVLLGFHYYNNGDVDYQAIGILKDFKHWKAWKDDITTTNIINMGFKGNIGGRYSFTVSNKTYILQEAQSKKNDFSTWKLLLGDGAFYANLNLQTPKGSKSFANPSITKIKNETFIISAFLPTEGNKRGENGQLLYTFKTH